MSNDAAIEGLEASLREKPDDWPTWLVYGDHLSSLGDVRGELIRLDHEGAMAFRDNARSRRLHNESRALIKQHEETWKAGLDHAIVLRWSHGFVTAVELTWSLESVASLEKFVQTRDARFLTRLSFPQRGVPQEALKIIEAVAKLELPLLRTFSLAYTGLGGAAVRVARGAKWFSSLVELDLRYCSLKDEGVAELRGAEFPKLTSLHLQSNDLTAAGISALGSLTVPALRSLDVRYNPLDEAGAQALSRLPFVGRLEKLMIRGRDVPTAAMREAAEAFPIPLRRFWSAW